MLETLVSSRVRRTLFEHILTHPQERFYLRGLAKELRLSVSPLRRELKRLAQSGMLKTSQEANVLYYIVQTNSPAFLQLKQAGFPQAPMAPRVQPPISEPVSAPAPQPAQAAERPAGRAAATSARTFWTSPLRTPVMVGVAGVGMAFIVILAGLLYVTVTNQRLTSIAQRILTAREVSARTAPAPMSPEVSNGVMRSSRWQLIPGGIGGLSTGAGREIY